MGGEGVKREGREARHDDHHPSAPVHRRLHLCSLYEAVEKSYQAADVDMESEFYLNNAGTGGTGTTGDVTPSGGGLPSGGEEPGE